MKKTLAISLALTLLVTLFVSFGVTPISVSAQQPTPAATTSAPPGLYVTSLRVQPAYPAFGQAIWFYPTFANTASGDFAATWLVYVWKANEVTKTNNETAQSFTHFPPGTAEYRAADDAGFSYGGTGRTCEYFFARVAMLDPNNKPIYLTDLSGKVVEQGFQICDAASIPTSVPVAAVATATPPPPPPGVFVTDIRTTPERPVFFKDSTFTPTFLNNADRPLVFKWRVFIYKTDNILKSNSETTYITSEFPVGTGEIPSLGNFSYGATGNSCENFFTRVGWLDSESKIQYFMFPDGRTFEKPFSVCDPSVIPTPAPVAAAAATAVPPPPPGLFVNSVALSPDKPLHNQSVSFTVNFKNTADRELTFPWKVYIYKNDNMSISNNETTKQTTSFPAGAAADYPSLGSFKYGATGYTCDDFTTRVGWLDENNKINFFMTPEGKMYEKPFSICN